MEDLKEELQALKAELEKVKAGPTEARNADTPQVVFAPKQRKVEKFTGKKGQGPHVYEFSEEIRRILKIRPTPVEEQVDFILSNLDGPAKEEMRFRPLSDKKSPKMVLDILIAVFGERATASELLSDFYQTKQTENQTLQEFSHLIMSKFDRVNRIDRNLTASRDIMLPNQFAENVFEPWLRRELKKLIRIHEELSFIDLREEAILLSQDLEKPKKKVEVYEERAVSAAQDTQNSDVMEMLKNLKCELSEIKKEVAKIKASKKKTVQCYKCKELGHIKRNCPKNELNQ